MVLFFVVISALPLLLGLYIDARSGECASTSIASRIELNQSLDFEKINFHCSLDNPLTFLTGFIVVQFTESGFSIADYSFLLVLLLAPFVASYVFQFVYYKMVIYVIFGGKDSVGFHE